MSSEDSSGSVANPLDVNAFDRTVDEAPVPTKVGRFRIVGTVGVGGMGRVLAAHDPSLDRIVALKVLRSSTTTRSDAGRARLLREARAMAQIRHENVVTVFDVGVHEGEVFIAMERVQGRDLRHWLAGDVRTREAIVQAFLGAGRGLAAAHAHGVVHRDFKPANVMIDEAGVAKVLDFGLARELNPDAPEGASMSLSGASLPGASLPGASIGASLGADASARTIEGRVMGTPKYMAPEQHTDEEATEAADQFAFCVALWEAIVGNAPFSGSDYKQLALAKLRGEIVAPPADVQTPAWLVATLRRGLAPRAGDRWPSMTALCDAIERTPTRRRRRRVLVSMAAGVAMTLAVFWMLPAAEPSPCTDGPARLDEVWSTVRSEGLERRAAELGDRATSTWDRVRDDLARRAEAWRTSYASVCASAESPAPTEIDARIDCLYRRLQELDAAARVLEEGDAAVWAEADAITIAMTPSVACESSWTGDGVPPPVPELAEAVEEIRRSLEWANARMHGGDIGGARTVALAAVERAEALSFQPVRAEARARLGEIRSQADEDVLAVEDLRTAYFAAKDCAHTTIEIAAATQLARITAELGGTNEPHTWIRHAEAALERIGWPAREHARLLVSQGAMLQHQGRAADAIEALRRASTILRDGEVHDVALTTVVDNNLAYALYQQGHYEEALALHLEVLAVRRRELGDHPYVISSLENVGVVLSAQESADEALEYHQEALERGLRVYGEDHSAVADTLNSIALMHSRRGELAEARTMLERVLRIATKRQGDDGTIVAMAHGNLGLVTSELGDTDAALEHYRQAIAIFERAHGPTHPRIASVLHNSANIHLERGDLDKAIEVFHEAIDLREQANGPDDAKLAFPLTGLGIALLRAKQPAEAEPVLERALELRVRHGVGGEELAFTRRNLAEALWANGHDRERALELADAARQGYAKADAPEEAAEMTAWLRSRH